MALENIWIATLSDGLIRADHVAGIEAHQTPELTGKASRWLLDVTLAAPAGSGTREGWEIAQLHRTLAQTDGYPSRAAEELARTLDYLRRRDIAGVLRAVVRHETLRFEFFPFDTGEDA
ncbi:hypothetical protein [Saccharomonospora piscinae]|uniref:Uncharacterized protein n=1 Tax=Saccharomonospora piscinae TaxID=687388 RepID=A0A1V9ACH0_SACPI|nr:hypothetical protein [Saccharomonospora piscinae]OQO94781.1 hypothetical protein B1813_01445 [Saccharomonospora piscinae]TLW94509.1 hypothetical protein FFT09_01010 [Saccharomonospora piscinae]